MADANKTVTSDDEKCPDCGEGLLASVGVSGICAAAHANRSPDVARWSPEEKQAARRALERLRNTEQSDAMPREERHLSRRAVKAAEDTFGRTEIKQSEDAPSRLPTVEESGNTNRFSDEAIWSEAVSRYPHKWNTANAEQTAEYIKVAFLDGAKWARDRIQQANRSETLQSVEISQDGKRAYVIGIPAESKDEDAGHNCDAMGCPSARAHTLYVLPIDSPA